MAKFAPRGTDLAKFSDGAVGPDGGVLLLEDSQKFFDCDIGPDMLERFVLLEVHWNIATGKGDDGVLPIRSWKCADSMHNAGSPRGLLVVAKKAGDAFPAKLRALKSTRVRQDIAIGQDSLGKLLESSVRSQHKATEA